MSLFKGKEKYYICENCGTLRTEAEFTKDRIDRLAYDKRICNCEYAYIRWDDNAKQFLPTYGKPFVPYEEIPKDIYYILKAEHNEVLRLKMFLDWKLKTSNKIE